MKASDLATGQDETFAYGDMTSVAISPDGTKLAVSMQDEDYTRPGRVLLFNCNADGTLRCIGIAATGVQPDMATFSADGSKILTANEGEPRQDYSADARGSEASAEDGRRIEYISCGARYRICGRMRTGSFDAEKACERLNF